MEAHQVMVSGNVASIFDETGDPVEILETESTFVNGGIEAVNVTVKASSGPQDDDLTVISGLGAATQEWLHGYSIRTFAALGALTDSAVAAIATDESRPKTVDVTKLASWRDAAAAQ